MKILNFVFLLLIGLFFLSCNRDEAYIVSKEDSLSRMLHTNKEGVVIMPPDYKFDNYNFIIDSSNNVYFYYIPESKVKLGVNDETKTVFLRSNHIFDIPKGSEEVFFKKNVPYSKTLNGNNVGIMLATFKDTINLDFLKYLQKLVKDKHAKFNLKIRIASLEERDIIKEKVVQDK